MVVNRFDVFTVNLNPTVGSEINKTRPCVIISPEEMSLLNSVIIAPMTTKGFGAPTRVPLTFQSKQGLVVLDQIRTIDKSRLHKKIGKINSITAEKISDTLVEMFCY